MKKSPQLWHPLIGAALALLLVLFSQHAALKDLFAAWQTEEYSHGILIPLIAVFLAWHRLAEAKPPLRPSWWGIGWLTAAAILQLVAALSVFIMGAEYALVVAFTGLSLAFFGRPVTRAIAPALVYLLFAIPLPHLVQSDLSERLQLWSSTLGVIPLDLLGISVFQQGNVIDLGSYRLQVVEACSGLRYLFPLMSFGYLVALLLKDSWWKRAVIFLSTIPLTIVLNSLRIAFIGIAVDRWGRAMAEGFIHTFEGWSVFLFCIAALLVEVWILKRIGRPGHFRHEYVSLPRGRLFGNKPALKGPGFAALAIAAILALFFGTGVMEKRAENVPAHPPFASFPLMIGDWHGQSDNLAPDVLQALQLSDYWLADYRHDEEAPVNLYIAYYASQRTGAMAHSPSNCIPGGGWQIETSRIQELPLARSENLKLTRLVIRRGDAAELVYYWFDERGRNLTETYSAKYYLLRDSILMNRTDGALIRLATPIGARESEADAGRRLNEFLTLTVSRIGAFIPGSPSAKPVAAP